MRNDYLEKLLQSKKYRDVCPDTVRRVWDECSRKYKKIKDVDKAAREALHGITGAFLTEAESRECAWAMQAWYAGGRTDAQLENILNKHASTRERLPLGDMDALYDRLFAVIGRPGRVLDLACGINPIYLAARGIHAMGMDISGSVVSLVNAFGENYGMPARAVCADLLCGGVPAEPCDVALLFKVLPLLERQKSGGAVAVMERVNARHLVASFPTRTLGGRNVGMAANYRDWMVAHMPKDRAIVESFEMGSELFFILETRRDR